MFPLYRQASLRASKAVTNTYSTSFSLGIRMLHRSIHDPIYAIYGFVRLADEIVDTFHSRNKEALLNEFITETFRSIEEKFSLNPVLQSFQWVVNKYEIDHHLIRAFIQSMEMDLEKKNYSKSEYKKYIYGSAEVVGLMCLKVFCHQQPHLYTTLTEEAKALGAAFQKINFLRDIKADYQEKGRTYFPGVDFNKFSLAQKQEIEKDLEKDFRKGRKGIGKLPSNARFGVYTAYIYYYALFQKIRGTSHQTILQSRVRIPNIEKYLLLMRSACSYCFTFSAKT
jgi:phytoene/squalene synthetase